MRGRLHMEPLTGPTARVNASVFRDGEGGALLVVANETGRALWSFNVRADPSGCWGDDILEGAVLPGEAVTWEIPPGRYHLRAETADGTRAYHFGLQLDLGQVARWVVGPG